jgi:hypothetical protein
MNPSLVIRVSIDPLPAVLSRAPTAGTVPSTRPPSVTPGAGGIGVLFPGPRVTPGSGGIRILALAELLARRG